VRAGIFLTEHIEVEGNFGYINHLEFEESDPESRGYLWEASAVFISWFWLFRSGQPL